MREQECEQFPPCPIKWGRSRRPYVTTKPGEVPTAPVAREARNVVSPGDRKQSSLPAIPTSSSKSPRVLLIKTFFSVLASSRAALCCTAMLCSLTFSSKEHPCPALRGLKPSCKAALHGCLPACRSLYWSCLWAICPVTGSWDTVTDGLLPRG